MNVASLYFFTGMALGILLAWLFLRSNSAVLDSRLSLLRQQLDAARADAGKFMSLNAQLNGAIEALKATVAAERKANEEKLELLRRDEEKLSDAFKALSADALKSNNQAFLELAKENLGAFQTEAKGDLELKQQAVENLVAPIHESLKKVDEQIQQIEKDRNLAYGGLTEQVRSLIVTQEKLQTETGNLVKALRAPTVRGLWGEIQLKRVVEMAGMLPYCDFVEQETVKTETGRLRPDLVVKLPGAKNIVIDAKTPLLAYLEAIAAADDEVRRQGLLKHAGQVRAHLHQLSSKAYWEQFELTPEFVVMFLPGETFFSAALEQDPTLIEHGFEQRVILASPTTLIALLKAVAYGWNQEKLAQNAQRISALGKELHDRLRNMGAHVEAMGKNLDRAVETYNKFAGSLESRVMVSARKFAELGTAVTEEIPELESIDTTTRNLTFEFESGAEDAPMNQDARVETGATPENAPAKAAG